MKKNADAMTPYRFFYELEKEMNLFSLEYHGVPYWQLARVVFLEEILMQRFNVTCQNGGRNVLQEMLGAYKARVRMKSVMKSLEKAEIIRLRETVDKSGGSFQNNPRYDYLQFGESVRIIDLYAIGNYFDLPECVKYSAATAEWKVILWKIKRKLLGVGELPTEQRDRLKSFFLKINAHYGTDFLYHNVLDTIQYTVYSHIQYKRFFERVFLGTSAKVLLVDLHYGDKQFGAIAAAKKQGVKVIELQHGAINQHKAFWYEDHSETGKILPDYFFVYGQWWKDQINMPPFVQVEPLGSPYVEAQIRKYPVNLQRERKTISFFSNILSGMDLISLIERNYHVLQQLNYRIIFKLHPNEVDMGWKDAYPFLMEHPEIEVVENESVYKLFAESDIVIGVISTVFFEALAYDHLKIALLTHVDCSEMRPLLENGSAIGIRGDEDFVRLLNYGHKAEGSGVGDKDNYWSKNAHQKTVEYIMNIINA